MDNYDFDDVFLKSYDELTEGERSEMKDLFTTEEEFNQMKLMMNSITEHILEQEKSIQPRPEVKQKLDHLFHQTYQQKGVLWYNSVGTFFLSSEKKWYQQNAIRIAAMLVLMLGLIPFWNQQSNPDKPQLAQHQNQLQEKQIDQTKQNQEIPADGKDLASEPELKKGPSFAESPQVAFLDDEQKSLEQPFNGTSIKTVDVAESISDIGFPSRTGSTHPDGIFVDLDEVHVTGQRIFAVKENPQLLDLLTATY